MACNDESSTDMMDLSCLKGDYADGPTTGIYIDLTGISNENFFRLLAERLGAHWEPIATFLGISSEKITTIKQQYPDPDEQIFQMLTLWHSNLGNTDNMQQLLINALSATGRKDLAMEISKGKWQRPVEPVIATTLSGMPHGSTSIEDREKKMRKLAEKISGEMEKLATELGVPSERVDKIKDKHRKVVEQSFQMLLCWQQRTPDINHRDVLITALKSIGRRDIARMIETETL